MVGMINNQILNGFLDSGCSNAPEALTGLHSPRSHLFFGESDMSRFKRRTPPLCECGCGEYVKWCPMRKQWNRFIHGHQNKDENNPNYGKTGKNSPNYGKDKYAKEKAKEAPICECGICGEKTKWCLQRKRYNRFIKGHQYRKKNNPNYGKDKYAEIRAKGAPICACGYCNRKTNWGDAEYNKYIDGHHNIERMKNGGSAYMLSFVKSPSKPQVELFELIKLFYPNAILNYPSLNKSIDVAIPEKMIAIEYDGSYWHQDEEADTKRQKELEAVGWKFLRYKDYVPSLNELKKDLQHTSAQQNGN